VTVVRQLSIKNRSNNIWEFVLNVGITSSFLLRNVFVSYSTKIASKNGSLALRPCDPLEFVDKKAYKDRLVAEQKRTGMTEACVAGRGYMRGRPLVIALTDSSFIMGSMGSVVGEKLTRSIEHATEQKLPLVIVSGSGGGARMHEGILSLMQMGKVSAALARYRDAGGFFISVLTNPTMGGVAASFASLGDITLAEPKALIGFAGPRVVKSTIKIELPEDFQTSEFFWNMASWIVLSVDQNYALEIARLIDYCTG
jgi:acetyl-CoA carboxylase carboxyl transferase subunit beta